MNQKSQSDLYLSAFLWFLICCHPPSNIFLKIYATIANHLASCKNLQRHGLALESSSFSTTVWACPLPFPLLPYDWRIRDARLE